MCALAFALSALTNQLIPRSSQAATIDWSASATTSVWGLGTNWVGLAAPANTLTTDIARFDQTSYSNQPNSGVTGTSINGIQIGDGTTATATLTLTNTALSIGSSGITMFANAGAATLTGGSVKIGANQNWANNSSNLLTISSNVTNNGNTTPFTLTLNGSGSGGTTIGGIISNGGTTGTTALTVNTTGGVTTLSGANTFTGGTTLTLGTLKLSGSGTLGGTSGALTVNGGTLDLNGTNQGVGNFTGSGGTILNNNSGTNVTLTIGNGNGTGGNYSGVIADNTSGTGTVAVTKTGTGTITLSGANTYTGATTVGAGILNIQNATALGTTAGGTSVTSGATLQIQGGITVGAEALTLNGNGAGGQNGVLVNVSGTNNYGGLITLGSASTISSDSGTLNLTNTGTITGATFGLTLTGAGSGTVSSIIGTTSGTLTKSGAGTWTLTGANTYTGATTINAGTLSVSSLANGGSNSNIGASTNAATKLVLNGGTLQYTGAAVSTDRLFSVGTSGGTLDASGTGAVNFTNTGSMSFNSQTGTRTLILTGTNTGSNTLAAVIGDNSGATSLTKNGTGNWVLGGANTYTGATTVNGGDLSTGTFTLNLSGAVSIASGATYTSTGTLNLNPDTSAAQTFVSGAGTLRLRNSSSTALAPDIYYDPTGNPTLGTGYPVTIASNIDVGTGTRYINGISQRNDYERYGGDLVFSGNLSGSANLTFTGTPNTGATGGPWQVAYTLAGNNSSFTGGIILTDGANLTLNNANALTSANTVTFTPSSGAVSGLYLYGRNVTIGALSGTAAGTMNIRNGSLVTDNNTTINPGIVRSNAVLTVQQDTNTTFNGTISDGLNDHGAGDSGTYYTLGLVKAGTGSLTLGGTNTYTGGTTINGGALVVNSAASLGATSGGLTINAGTLEVATGYSTSRTITLGNAASTFQIDPSQTFTVTTAIGGTGALNKTGTGTMVLTASDSYSGGTTISNGILALGADSGGTENAGSLGSGAVTITGGGQLRFGGSSGAIVTYNIANNITLNNGTIVVADGAQHLQGTFAVGASGGTLITQYSTKDLYLDGVVSGSGALLVDNLVSPTYGDGQVHFTGTNTYSGTLTVSASGSGSDGGKISVDSNNALASATIAMNGPRDINFATTAPVFGALSGTGNITLTSGLNLSVGGNNATTTYSGIFSGAGSLTKAGTGTMTLSGANTYTGATTDSAGTLQFAKQVALYNNTTSSWTASNIIVNSSATAAFNVGGTGEFTSANIDTLKGLGTATGGFKSGSILGLDTTNASGGNFTYSSVIANPNSGANVLGLTKLGTNTLTLNGASTYTGATTINAGKLTLDNNNTTTARIAGTSGITVNAGGTLMLSQTGVASNDRINNSATMTLNGGTFNTGGLSEHGASNNTAGIGALTLQSTSTIDMGNGSSIVAFANSHLASWSGTLNIYDWTGTVGQGGGTDQLYIGSDNTGLTASQLAEINFYSDMGTTFLGNPTILANGEICPIPEPSTWLAAALSLAAVGYAHRRRLYVRRAGGRARIVSEPLTSDV